MTFTAISALCLLSYLGVEGDENVKLWYVGGAGVGSMCLAVLISVVVLFRIRNERQKIGLTTLNGPRSFRGFSLNGVDEGAIVLAVV